MCYLVTISESFSSARVRSESPLCALSSCPQTMSTLISESVREFIIFLHDINFELYWFSEDDVCKEVSVNIDGEETRIIFVDHQHGEMSVCERKLNKPYLYGKPKLCQTYLLIIFNPSLG